jgi:predicted nuclease of predicted toxin-antitoxin system
MARLLANENVPADAVEAIRQAGHDLAWVRETSPGATDEVVLAQALAERRVLLTFDKDFGELAFRRGLQATPGIILLRPRLRSPDYVVRFTFERLEPAHHMGREFCTGPGRARARCSSTYLAERV